MNINQRETKEHVKFEPNTYFAAFSAELEASAYPMWALVSHLTDASTAPLTRKMLSACLKELQRWLDAINFIHLNTVSFGNCFLRVSTNFFDFSRRTIISKCLSTCLCTATCPCSFAKPLPNRGSPWMRFCRWTRTSK
jgi:hypothetical protein